MFVLYDGYLVILFIEVINFLFVIFISYWGIFVLFKGFILWFVYWCGVWLFINNLLFVFYCIL